VAELETLLKAAIEAGGLPDQDAAMAARALLGAFLEALVGPLAPAASDAPGHAGAAVQAITLLALRGLGVPDAHARGLILQTRLPPMEPDPV
jgi:hypothetical protein